MSRVIFFMDYDKYGKTESPPILFLVQILLDKGHDVDFVTSRDALIDKAGTGRYDSLCISMHSVSEIRETLKTAIQIKKIDPHIVTILGGQGAAGLSSELIHAQGIDCIVDGEGEIILPILLDYLIRAPESVNLSQPFNDKAEVRISDKEAEECGGDGIDLLFKDRLFYLSPIDKDMVSALSEMTFERKIDYNGEEIIINVPLSGVIIKTTNREIISLNIDENDFFKRNDDDYWRTTGNRLPLSPIKLAEYGHVYPTQEELIGLLKAYPWEIVLERGWNSIGIYSQKGCNWGICTFCGIKIPANRRYETSFIARVLKEAAESGINGAAFYDDLFIQEKKWVEELCNELIAAGINTKLSLSAVIKVESGRDKQMVELLKDAGFTRLQIGVESFLSEKIRYFNKSARGYEDVYCRAAKDVILNCLELGIVPEISIILTRPDSDRAMVEITEELTEVVNVLFRAYQDFKVLPVISFNDLLMAYPNAPLLSQKEYERQCAPLTAVEIIEGGKVFLGLKKMGFPQAYKLNNSNLALFITELANLAGLREELPTLVYRSLEHIDDILTAFGKCVERLNNNEKDAVNNKNEIEDRLAMIKKRLDLDVKSFLDRVKEEIGAIRQMEGAERQLFYLNKKREEVIRYSNNIRPDLRHMKTFKKLIEWLNNITNNK